MKNTAHTPQKLLHDLQALVTQAEAMVAGSIAEHSDDALGNLRARFNAAQDSCAEAYAGARDKVVTGARDTDQRIRAHPYQSIAIAAGVALLVGVLVGRTTTQSAV
jgi:ElaB/YqjD/DUF883 family membrane-anchored ribosome-binding protein